MADQLGATRRTPEAAGPDWSQQARSSSAPAWATQEDPPAPTGHPGTGEEGADPSDDDEDLTTSDTVGQPVIENVLGGTVIAINDDPVA